MLRHASTILATGALALLVASCEKPMEEGDAPMEDGDRKAVADAFETLAESGGGILMRAQDCATMAEPICTIKISGVPGDAADLELKCDGVTYETVTATIAAGETTAKERSSGTLPTGRGPFSISDKVAAGAPTVLYTGCY